VASTIPYWVTFVVPAVSLLLSFAVKNRSNFRAALGELLIWVLYFVSAGVSTAIVTEVLKNLVGRMRPDFLARCIPDADGPVYIDAFGATSSENPPCTNEDIAESKLQDGHKSFPSGHSSTAFALGVYVVVYCGWWLTRRPKMSAVMQTAIAEIWMAFQIAWAFGVASSRVMDNKHHVGDVAAGALIGILMGGLYGFRSCLAMVRVAALGYDEDASSEERCILQDE
jgi:membrane-associated phospholipid phosphatase